MGNIKTFISRAVDICLTDEYLKEELEHIGKVFHHRNKYPLWVINKVIDDAKKIPSANENDASNNEKIHRLMLPYQGDKGFNLLKPMKRYSKNFCQSILSWKLLSQVKNLIHVSQ